MLESLNRQNGAGVYKRLIVFSSRHWLLILIGIIATAFGSGIDAGLAWLVKPIMDKGLVNRDVHFIGQLPYLILIIFFLRGVMSFTSGYCISAAGRKVIMRFRQGLFDKLLLLPFKFYDLNSSGKLLSIVLYNVTEVASAATDSLLTLVRESILCIGLLIVMLQINWRLAVVFFFTIPVAAVIIRYSSTRMRRISSVVQDRVGDVSHIVEETITGKREVSLYGAEDYERNKLKQATHNHRQQEMKTIVTNSSSTGIIQFLMALPIAVILYLSMHVKMGVTPGGFASIIIAMFGLLRPIQRLSRLNINIQKGLAAAQSIFQLLDKQSETDLGTKTIDRAKGDLEFKKVNFCYQNTTKPALFDVNITIKAGQTIALVGHSGSGKSTLINLLPRFYQSYQGKILLDGIDTKSLTLENLRHQFALVSQDVKLFNDSVSHNIAYGDLKNASEAQIVNAAKMAYADEFIEQLPNGYDTNVGQQGTLLSGGQKQRIAIARAFLKDAPILILDEATSALDSESEYYIKNAFNALKQNKTTLIIAHRLSTIEDADLILVMDKGKIVETGTHQELVSANSYYARLHAMQFKKDNEG